ncbi:SpoVR family protein [Paraliobacillus sp. JSM ZJ581]|uniref:SpoVR family protein n=1 Tax=Paraliobacillus sp. JSM ZJ581 TaxID=3342118 RepID=UPI0035A94137
MKQDDLKQLKNSIEEITEIAKGFGLDFFPMRYEICPPEIIYTFGSYGMPSRFSHWSFGKQFHLMKLQYDLGLSKIYELVINSNPCYAFLLHSNRLIQNKLIVAHVLAHSDFFKNNVHFSNTRRDMIESMSVTAERIASYENQYGKENVESFLDAVLAIHEHIEPPHVKQPRMNKLDKKYHLPDQQPDLYDDLWHLEELNQASKIGATSPTKTNMFPSQPEKDLLLFIETYSEQLEEWQRHILEMMRVEMLYFWPQLETKIMNEGWASYWHQRILREMDLNGDEVIEFAKLNASMLRPSKTKINPYYLGVKLFEDIEERFDYPTEEMKKAGVLPYSGREKMFEVREMESDSSFLRNYITKRFVDREDLYLFQKQGSEYTVIDKDWMTVRDQLIQTRMNGGYPYLTVQSGNYRGDGGLYLLHHYEEVELDVHELEKTLPFIYQLWGRNVYLETVIENKCMIFLYNGTRVIRKEK